jgi:hypothetical protein
MVLGCLRMVLRLPGDGFGLFWEGVEAVWDSFEAILG